MIKIGFKACRMKTFKMKLENLPDVVYSISEKKIPYKICSLQGDILTVQHPCRTMFGRGVFILFLKEMSILTKGSKIAWFSRADCDGFSKC